MLDRDRTLENIKIKSFKNKETEIIFILKHFNASQLLMIPIDNKRAIKSALRVRLNPEYSFMGYITRQDRLAPVFKSVLTGEKIVIC